MAILTQNKPKNPRVGMMAIVRKRRAVISEVRPFDGDDGIVHLVRLEYKDNESPETEQLIWECEPYRELLSPAAVPLPSDPPMPPDDFDAVVRASRWSALSPYLDPDGDGPLDRMPVCSPFHGAVQVEDYQMVPLLKALRMPRINMMIADDVGLGKTIEAGLVLRELLIRRRIRRVLVLTPASLRVQWRDEMWDKFSLPMDVIDRDATQKLKRTIGIDANPWRSSARAITSYHYLKQPDVLEQFLSACQVSEDSPHLPWDLLIVDEVHNLMPSAMGEDSDLCRMLRLVAPYFEHRLFLTATPHNGRTRSFSGLLEMLDPVRFSQTDQLKPAERRRIEQVVVRRLKRDINARTDPPKFSERKEPQAIPLRFDAKERRLIAAVDTFRDEVRRIVGEARGRRRISGIFAIEILGKRLLSGPATFAESWYRCKLGLLEEEEADDREMAAASRSVAEDTADDNESQQREASATTVIGAWLNHFADELASEIEAIDDAVQELGFPLPAKADDLDLTSTRSAVDPKADARFDVLIELIETQLHDENGWLDDERLVVFTEYKTTLDYLLRRVREKFSNQKEGFLALYGGMDDQQREQIKEKFNDPDSGVRVLIATDAASEGLNLQDTARHLLHFDCPWNPARIEQRNGRLDRHGQARDVFTYHFISQENADLRFMSRLIHKVDQMREDLGAVGEILDEAMHRQMIKGETVDQKQLDLRLENAKGQAEFEGDASASTKELAEHNSSVERLEALAAELDFDGDAQYELLDVAMGMGASRPQLGTPDVKGRCRILNPSLPLWSDTIDQSIRRGSTGNVVGALPYLAFTAEPCLQKVGNRLVFRPPGNLQMMHLGHPLVSKAIGALSRRRYPGPSAVSRWTVRVGEVPSGADAFVLLHLEELAVNGLRETFHHWIRTVTFTVNDGELSPALPHVPARQLRNASPTTDEAMKDRAADIFADIELDLSDTISAMRANLTNELTEQLAIDGKNAIEQENKNFASRQGEVSTLIADNTLEKIEKEINALKRQRQEGRLFDNEDTLDEIDRDIAKKKEEIERRTRHYKEVRNQLARERERVINRLLPKRYSIDGEASVFPLAVEIRLPG
ncbi:DISARM system SNF2-like helicase DrmD [Crateriforma spongiae]|uniref:DISARM system SNF2-like helicase DrmD n=1 Tax=Crateriforma spongiae TaxID=2724528 RepID=UPI0014487996|nr:DISARM system SNF2-like helicase DrmD [Crateriforma spongiae]